METYTNKGGTPPTAAKSPTVAILPNVFTKVFSKSDASLKDGKEGL
jgi:hypothetical protein